MAKPNPSGSIRLEKEAIVYSVDGADLWRIRLGNVRVIGEYTIDHGPGFDDYFFVFVTERADCWFEASFYADGTNAFLQGLSARLEHELRAGLCNSTDFKSRVLWPPQLEGEELFVFVPETKAKTILGKVRQSILPHVFFELSEPVRKLIVE